ncbi:MAG: B12-binding domain-containing radical SAM protein [Clostridia bacterium]|nr:B12-binding domain-containing radical SAM protein [Clostridia bacterium]
MRYEGSIYRPPSEAHSLILQITIGCAHNKCTFCSMFIDKKFRIRKLEDVIEDIEYAKLHYGTIKRFFLADGDALVLKTDHLITILDHIKRLFPECERIGIYATPQDILRKSPEDLKRLHEHGLGIAYVGVESGSEQILKDVKKGVTRDEIIESGKKINASGIDLSITLISGLGGKDQWREHAAETGKIISEMNPKYVGLLTLMLEPGTELYKDIQDGKFQVLTPEEVLYETEEMIKHINVSKECIFRSNHASNYFSLKGTLPDDKERLLQQINSAKHNTGMFKDERFRML